MLHHVELYRLDELLNMLVFYFSSTHNDYGTCTISMVHSVCEMIKRTGYTISQSGCTIEVTRVVYIVLLPWYTNLLIW